MKAKFKSAEDKRKAIEAEKFQQQLYKKWNIDGSKPKSSNKTYKPIYSRSFENKLPSIGISGGKCLKQTTKQYTGTLIVGIATMHKSNAVPIINKEQAKEISSMRR